MSNVIVGLSSWGREIILATSFIQLASLVARRRDDINSLFKSLLLLLIFYFVIDQRGSQERDADDSEITKAWSKVGDLGLKAERARDGIAKRNKNDTWT